MLAGLWLWHDALEESHTISQGLPDSTGLVVPAGGRVVAVVGLEDVVVVDTGDALLVTTRARAQDVKSIVAALKEDGHVGLT